MAPESMTLQHDLTLDQLRKENHFLSLIHSLKYIVIRIKNQKNPLQVQKYVSITRKNTLQFKSTILMSIWGSHSPAPRQTIILNNSVQHCIRKKMMMAYYLLLAQSQSVVSESQQHLDLWLSKSRVTGSSTRSVLDSSWVHFRLKPSTSLYETKQKMIAKGVILTHTSGLLSARQQTM